MGHYVAAMAGRMSRRLLEVFQNGFKASMCDVSMVWQCRELMIRRGGMVGALLDSDVYVNEGFIRESELAD